MVTIKFYYVIILLLILSCKPKSGSRTSVTAASAPSQSRSTVTTQTATLAEVISISPNYYHRNGGISITIKGKNFTENGSIFIGSKECEDLVGTSSDSRKCTLPSNLTEGQKVITEVDIIYKENNIEKAKLTKGFAYIGRPSLWLDATRKKSIRILNGRVKAWEAIPWEIEASSETETTDTGLKTDTVAMVSSSLEKRNSKLPKGAILLAGGGGSPNLEPESFVGLQRSVFTQQGLYIESDRDTLPAIKLPAEASSFLTGPLLNVVFPDSGNFSGFIVIRPEETDISTRVGMVPDFFPMILGSQNNLFGMGLDDNKAFMFVNETSSLVKTAGVDIVANEKALLTFGMFNKQLKISKNGGTSSGETTENGIPTATHATNFRIGIGKGDFTRGFKPYKGLYYEIILFEESLDYPSLRIVERVLKEKWKINL